MIDIQFIHILVFVPLIIALISFNKAPKYIPLILISTSITSSFFGSIVDLLSAFILIGYGLVCYLYATTQNKRFQTVSSLIILSLTIVLMSHMLTGIINPKIIDDYYFSKDAVSFSKYLNIDKVIAGVFLLLYVVPKPKKVSYENNIIAVLITTLFISITLIFATYLGKINIDPKVSELIIPWALTNLFFTCYVEEAFFRGFIQENITSIFNKYKYSFLIAIFISGIAFGLIHLPAGLIYTCIATIIGCSLAYIYYKTKNIHWPIFAHFGFNLTHFVFFTYPYIR